MTQSQFFRRKQSKKRRPRTTFEPPDSSNLDPIVSSKSTVTTPTASVSTLQSGTERSRLRLRPPPTVFGYETIPTASDAVADSRYSAEELSALRSSTKSIPLPFVKHQSAASSLTARPLPDDPPPPVHPSVPVRKGLSPSKSEQYEQSQSNLRSPVKLADPFSEEWGRGIEDQPCIRLDSDDEIHVRMHNGPTVEKLASGSGDEDDENDDEWHQQLLRRAGINLSTASKKSEGDAFLHDEYIMRDLLLTDEFPEDESMATLLGNSLTDIAIHREHAEHFAKGEIEKCAKLNRIVNDSNSSRKNSNDISQTDINTEKFYCQFASEMEQLSLSLKENRVNMLQFRKMRLTRLQQRASFVVDYLKKDVDEFGRMRRLGHVAEIPCDEIEPLSAIHPLSNIPEDQRNIIKLAARFALWKQRFPEDYSAHRGDVGLGRIVGALSTCEATLTWLTLLSREQRLEACKVVDVVEEATLVLRATWLPTDVQNCEDVGRILIALLECTEEEKEYELLATIEDRVAFELAAAEDANDCTWVWKLLNGTLLLTKITERNCGIQPLLKAVQKDFVSARNLPLVLENLQWLITSDFGKKVLTTDEIKEIEVSLQSYV